MNKILRHISAALAIIIILSSSLTVYAAGETQYSFSGIDLKVKVSDDLIVFTRHITDNNAYLELIGADDAASVRTIMEKNNIYLEAVNSEATYEIAITGTKLSSSSSGSSTNNSSDGSSDNNFSVNIISNNIQNLADYSESALEDAFALYLSEQEALTEDSSDLTEQIQNSGIEIINDIPYFITELTSINTELTKIYVKKYYTIVNGYEYNYAIQSNGNEINDEMNGYLASILESASYVKVRASLFDNTIFLEIFTTVATVAGPIILLALIILVIRYFSKTSHNKLINEEAKLREEYDRKHDKKA